MRTHSRITQVRVHSKVTRKVGLCGLQRDRAATELHARAVLAHVHLGREPSERFGHPRLVRRAPERSVARRLELGLPYPQFRLGQRLRPVFRGLRDTQGHSSVLGIRGGRDQRHREFSPVWSAQLESGLALPGGLEVDLKFWRLEFEGTGASVISPAVLYDVGLVSLSIRYFVWFGAVNGVTQSAFGRAGIALGGSWATYVGGGGGTGSDYLDVQQNVPAGFWFAMAGVSRQLGWRQRLIADYVHRYEWGGASTYIQDKFSLGYELRL